MNRVGVAAPGVLLSLTILVSGCTSASRRPELQVFGSIVLPPDARQIALSVGDSPDFSLEIPFDRKRAASEGADIGLESTLGSGSPFGPVIVPLGYLIGRSVGWTSGVDAGQLRADTASVLAATKNLHLETAIARDLTGCLRSSPALTVRRVANDLPTQPPPSRSRFTGSLRGSATWETPPPPRHPLAHTTADTLVSIKVRKVGFTAVPGGARVNGHGTTPINPPLFLEFSASVEVIRVHDWSPVGGLTISYTGPAMKFGEWAAHDAARLQAALAAATCELTAEIVSRVSCEPTLASADASLTGD